MMEKMNRFAARGPSRRYMGEAVLRAEDRELLQGRGGFLADLLQPGAAEVRPREVGAAVDQSAKLPAGVR